MNIGGIEGYGRWKLDKYKQMLCLEKIRNRRGFSTFKS